MLPDSFAGKTPHQTMKSKLSVHIRRFGQRSPFVRTAPGKFYLRRLLPDDQAIYLANRLQPPTTKEFVLVFPAAWMDATRRFQGIRKHWRTAYDDLSKTGTCLYMDRHTAEQDDAHKQVLTYIMVTRGRYVLAFKRGTYNRVADYLRGSQCIGFGGHVTAEDRSLFGATDMGIMQSAARELLEELTLPKDDKNRLLNGIGLRCIGILNDDSSDVGRRHFAFLLRYEVSSSPYWIKPSRGEKSITQLRWLDPTATQDSITTFEYWSQLCLREYFPQIVRAQPSFLVRRRAPLVPPHLVCVLGPVGSGKSEATRVLVHDYGYSEINSGRVLAAVLGVPPVPDTPREEFQALAMQFIERRDGPPNLR